MINEELWNVLHDLFHSPPGLCMDAFICKIIHDFQNGTSQVCSKMDLSVIRSM